MSDLDTSTEIIIAILYIASLIHVAWESKHKEWVGRPIQHTLMVAVLWPLTYLFWILWWPGSLRQWFFGSDKERIEKRVKVALAREREGTE